jgi:hypothetical protein
VVVGCAYKIDFAKDHFLEGGDQEIEMQKVMAWN